MRIIIVMSEGVLDNKSNKEIGSHQSIKWLWMIIQKKIVILPRHLP